MVFKSTKYFMTSTNSITWWLMTCISCCEWDGSKCWSAVGCKICDDGPPDDDCAQCTNDAPRDMRNYYKDVLERKLRRKCRKWQKKCEPLCQYTCVKHGYTDVNCCGIFS